MPENLEGLDLKTFAKYKATFRDEEHVETKLQIKKHLLTLIPQFLIFTGAAHYGAESTLPYTIAERDFNIKCATTGGYVSGSLLMLQLLKFEDKHATCCPSFLGYAKRSCYILVRLALSAFYLKQVWVIFSEMMPLAWNFNDEN